MDNKNIKLVLLLPLTICAFFCQKSSANVNAFPHPFYIGAIGGYGSTTWKGLVPPHEKQNLAMSLSTPTEVSEGGSVWGFFSGYELNQFFAIEASYMHYPDAQITFDSMSLFTFLHDGLTTFTTHTESVNLMGKFMVIIPKTTIRAFSSIGAAGLHRDDLLYESWRVRPTFGVGFNTNFTPHLMGEIGANFTAGYGEAQINPTEVYFPFLYSVTARIAYRF